MKKLNFIKNVKKLSFNLNFKLLLSENEYTKIVNKTINNIGTTLENYIEKVNINIIILIRMALIMML
jgi:hypothetical protein